MQNQPVSGENALEKDSRLFLGVDLRSNPERWALALAQHPITQSFLSKQQCVLTQACTGVCVCV